MTETGNSAARRSRTGKPVALPTGGRLSMEAASRITAEHRTRVVILAGPQKSGKTTLLAEIYSHFQFGPFGGCAFAGSSTLMAFERACHESRNQSGLEVPTTTRTSRADTGMLHLVVLPDGGATVVQLLLSDISGEHFEAMLDLPSRAASVPALSRADAVALAIDGEQLATLGSRNKVQYDAEFILDAIVEQGNLRPDAAIDAVITKWDWISSAGPGAEQFANEVGLKLVARAAPHPSSIIRTCARSLKDPAIASGRGLDELLRRWTDSSIVGDFLPSYRESAASPTRAIDKSGAFD